MILGLSFTAGCLHAPDLQLRWDFAPAVLRGSSTPGDNEERCQQYAFLSYYSTYYNYKERKSGGVETKTRKKGGIYYVIERGEEENEGHKQVHCL